MPEVLALILLVVGIVIVAALTGVAWRQYRELRRRHDASRHEVLKRQQHCIDSLEVIGRAMLAEQMDLVEGCLRSRVIVDHLNPELLREEPFEVIARVSEEADHLHTHQARARLSPAQRMREDGERIELADRYRDRIMRAAQTMADRQLQASDPALELGLRAR
ncbi:DUF2489 domain-containing protein [Kushneria aurantia]|uniref:DUF2489 domain-containing protein n=1 Tax=Kushneria aurantia TaxID=504092 RepID=A0ABV6G4N8_9GAMM|nr:DUF2489 domain-containing protein [Kushneria aurantia]